MTELPQIDNLRQLFLGDTPLLDVRAPVEFIEGSFPRTENHPLINDDERHRIGIEYKEMGQDAAVELGTHLVAGDLKAARIAAWRDFARRHPEGVLYCFRGGMRSKISQQWLYEEAGILYPRVKGGYKAMRRFLIDELEVSIREINPVVIGGRTGSGKTLLLKELDNTLDLEALAWHRGSAFGRHATPQPTQIDFENALSIALLKHRANGNPPLIIEDESKSIGSRHLPAALYEKFRQGPLLILEVSDEERVEITLREYVEEASGEYLALHGEQNGFTAWRESMLDSIDRIQKRLGGVRHAHIRHLFEKAADIQKAGNGIDAHRDWIRELLIDYYDPMYDYQIGRNAERIAFRGNRDEIKDYLGNS